MKRMFVVLVVAACGQNTDSAAKSPPAFQAPAKNVAPPTAESFADRELHFRFGKTEGWEAYRHPAGSKPSNDAKRMYRAMDKLSGGDCSLNGFCILEADDISCDRASSTCTASQLTPDQDEHPTIKGRAATDMIKLLEDLDRTSPGGRCDADHCRLKALACIEMTNKEVGVASYTCDDSRSGAAATSAAPAKTASVSCAGKRAEKTEWFGLGYDGVEVTCENGEPMLIETSSEPRGDAETHKYKLARGEWDKLWARLDAASWKSFPAECPDTDDHADIDGTGLDLEVTDGSTTKSVSCGILGVTAAYIEVAKAFDAAYQSACKSCKS